MAKGYSFNALVEDTIKKSSGGLVSGGNIHLATDIPLYVGSTQAGRLFHSSGDTFLEARTGNLVLKSDNHTYLQGTLGTGVVLDHIELYNDKTDMSVRLNHTGSLRLNTEAYGVAVRGVSGSKIDIGSTSTGNFIKSGAGTTGFAITNQSAGTDLVLSTTSSIGVEQPAFAASGNSTSTLARMFHGGLLATETTSSGLDIYQQGNLRLKVSHNGTNGSLTNSGQGDFYLVNEATAKNVDIRVKNASGVSHTAYRADGATSVTAQLFSDSSLRLQTAPIGVNIYGTGNNSTAITHDGVRSNISNLVGDIRLSTGEALKNVQLQVKDGSSKLGTPVLAVGGSKTFAQLRYDDIGVLNTITGGIYVGGNKLLLTKDASYCNIHATEGHLYLATKDQGRDIYLNITDNNNVEANGVVVFGGASRSYVNLYENGARRFGTTPDGVSVVGVMGFENSSYMVGADSNRLEVVTNVAGPSRILLSNSSGPTSYWYGTQGLFGLLDSTNNWAYKVGEGSSHSWYTGDLSPNLILTAGKLAFQSGGGELAFSGGVRLQGYNSNTMEVNSDNTVTLLAFRSAGVRGGYVQGTLNDISFLDAGGNHAVRHINDIGTYFYQNNGQQKARIDNSGVYSNHAIGTRNHIVSTDGYYTSTSGTEVGAIKIVPPVSLATSGNAMLNFWVDVYDYNSDRSYSVRISGYNFNPITGPQWINCSSLVIGSNEEIPISFGLSDGKLCVYIGSTTRSNSYPQVHVRDVTLGFTHIDFDNFATGWVVSVVNTPMDVVQYEDLACMVFSDNYLPTPSKVGLAPLSVDTSNTLKVTSSFGSMSIGPLNPTYCHLFTDRPEFYFNKGLTVEGRLGVYQSNTYLTATEGYIDGRAILTKSVLLNQASTDLNKVSASDEHVYEGATPVTYRIMNSQYEISDKVTIVKPSNSSGDITITFDDAANIKFPDDTTASSGVLDGEVQEAVFRKVSALVWRVTIV